jgi:phosphate-selective porin OprO and OprP
MRTTPILPCFRRPRRRTAARASLLVTLSAVSALGQEPPPAEPASNTRIAPSPAAPALVGEQGEYPFAPGEEELVANHPLDSSKSTVKPGTGFVFQSADGLFSFDPRLRAQFLYEFEDAEGEDAAESVQIRRARLQFKGNLYGKNNKYKVELAVSPGDVAQNDGAAPGQSILLDWYLDFTHIRDLSLRLGQYKVPFNRQRVVSSGDLEFVDRSIVNAEFSLDRDIGFDLRSEDLFGLGSLRYYLGMYSGEGRNTRGFYDFGMMYVACFEVLPMGMFDDYAEGDLERVASPKLSIGVSGARLTHGRLNRGILGSAPSDGGTTDYNTLAADAVFRFAGFSATTEWIFRDGDRNFGTDGELEGPRDGFGGMGQLTYLFPTTRIQVGARYGFIERAGDASVLPESNELGGGVSYYFAHHPFKLQADYFRLGAKDEDETIYSHRVRVQLQAGF